MFDSYFKRRIFFAIIGFFGLFFGSLRVSPPSEAAKIPELTTDWGQPNTLYAGDKIEGVNGTACTIGLVGHNSDGRWALTASKCFEELEGNWYEANTRKDPKIGESTHEPESIKPNYHLISVEPDVVLDSELAGTSRLVEDVARPEVGKEVCRSDENSGAVCGKILAVLNLFDPNGNLTRSQIRTDICASPGDEGSPLWLLDEGSPLWLLKDLVPNNNGVELVGMLSEVPTNSDGTAKCTEGKANSFYTSLDLIVEAEGLNINT